MDAATRHATVSGDPDGGYIVDLHDTAARNGAGHHGVFTTTAASMDEALKSAWERFDGEVRSLTDSDEPAAAVQDVPAPVIAAAEHPERQDPNAVDVTRGRAGDEALSTLDPDAAEHPSLPIVPGDNMVNGDDQDRPATEKAGMAEDRMDAEGDHTKEPRTPGEHIELAEQRAAEHHEPQEGGE